MKNRMLKGAHLSERKCREIINLFCEDLTATQISNITGVSRVTINAYLKMIRTSIAQNCDENNPFRYGSPESFSEDVNMVVQPSTYFGFTRWNNQIYTSALKEMNRDMLLEWQRLGPEHWSQAQQRIHAVADIANWRLHRFDQQLNSNGRLVMDDISGFWGLTKNRLLKFRGLNRNTLYLHIKECEFRYNYRNENMNALLLQLILRKPLHEVKLAV
ncbi:hypothetical protein KJS94_01095 [Flavihumibacter rivuli]|uniref:hypothetical protein n=1 Tax=Flavihumibacter rivuli TaxID=2838156 RepID=UPI001BDEE6A4|nr:hypothetical protein [Flavihumibacter rivuli]ULQ56791.1 hypothetical protein KJS94_01095 [Flavihumibacter rivuli]